MTVTGDAFIGIDHRDDIYYVARVHYGSGRPEVKALARFESGHLAGHHLIESGCPVLSVPDRLVRVSSLNLEPSEAFSVKDRTAFELAQMQLEPEDDFAFDSLPIDDSGRCLGMAVRRTALDRLSECLGPNGGTERHAVSYRPRAEALGRGYLTFCRANAGELVCLTDVVGGCFSICFICDRRIVGLAHVECPGADETQPADAERLALEFRMVVNYQLSVLMEQGTSLPLSALVLCGASDQGALSDAMRRYFPSEVTPPQLHDGFFADSSRINHLRLDKYLVALGLTVS